MISSIFADPSYWHWLMLACILLALEILASGAFFFLWLSLAALASTAVALFAPDLAWQPQFALFALFCIISLLAWKHFDRRAEQPSDQPLLNQRNQQLLGLTLTLSEAISAGHGKVIHNDSHWKVTGPELPVGARVKVIDLQGSSMLVVEQADD